MIRRVWRTANALTLAAVLGFVAAVLGLEFTILGGEGYVFSLFPQIHLLFLAAWIGGLVAASIVPISDRPRVFAAIATTLVVGAIGACMLLLRLRGSLDFENVVWSFLCGFPLAGLSLPVAYPVALALLRRNGTLPDALPRYFTPPRPAPRPRDLS